MVENYCGYIVFELMVFLVCVMVCLEVGEIGVVGFGVGVNVVCTLYSFGASFID